MNDQITLLRDGIPLGIWLLLAAIVVATIASVLATVLRSGPGNERTLRITSGVLGLMGLCVAGYVVYKTQILNEVPQCVGGGGGCALVERSDYSELAGIHVSIFGVIGYVLILIATIRKDDLARVAAFVLSFFGFGFSVYLTYLELYDIKAICQWCVASAVLMTMLFVVNTTRALSYYGLDDEADS
jgi:uncharacterized membrane protein